MASRVADVGHDVYLKHLIAATRTWLGDRSKLWGESD